MKEKIILVFVLCAIAFTSMAQENSQQEFTITGSPIITLFANYHAGLGEHNDMAGFSLTRAYLGYQFKLSEELSGKAVLDAGISPEESLFKSAQRDVILKNAFITWKKNGLTINGGLVSTLAFNVQEKFWDHRYIVQTFQDLYKMNTSADLGMTVAYEFTPAVCVDASITNGEGYKNLNMDNKYRFGLGITAKPLKSLTLRLFGDIRQNNNITSKSTKNQQTVSAFAGYSHNKFSFGAEYNYQFNQAFVDQNDYYGYSIYTNILVSKKWSIFARYDRIDSKDQNDHFWFQSARDLMIGGAEFKPIKQLRIAPNYKYAVNDLIKGPIHEIYLNVGFNW